MPYKGADDDQKKLSEYARPNLVKMTPAPVLTVSDEIVQALEELLAEIKANKIEPSHLIMGYGYRTTIQGQPATSYLWDAIGLDAFEVIGHVHTYATKLALGEGE